MYFIVFLATCAGCKASLHSVTNRITAAPQPILCPTTAMPLSLPLLLPRLLRCADFICASPLLPSCGISREQVEAEVARWVELGGQVVSNLAMPPLGQLQPAQK